MSKFDNLVAHPLANMFPMINKEDYPAFKADIEEHGVTDQIVLLDGKILDGRNRYRALTELECAGRKWLGGDDIQGFSADDEAGTDGLVLRPLYVEFDELGLDMSPFDFVISKNMQRRHLNESQRSMIAARSANMRQGERTDIKADEAPLDNTEPSANLRKVSQGEAASLFKVSERMVTGANTIIRNGIEALQGLVDAGELAVSVAEQVSKLPKSEQERVVEGVEPDKIKGKLKQIERERREAELAAKQMALPLKKFGVIYADPEWKFEVRSEGGMDRSAENHYPCSPYEEIMARRVQDIAADDCVLFMWATVPCLMEAICVLDAWGFVVLHRDTTTGHLKIDKKSARYVSQWSWIKHKIANGYWGRNKHEILLIATKGRPVAPALGTQPPSVIEARMAVEQTSVAPYLDEPAVTMEPAKDHSHKPEVFAEWIEKLFPNTPKIELNARRARPGWEVWGNEAPEAVAAHPPCEALAKGYKGELLDAIADKMGADRGDVATFAAVVEAQAKAENAKTGHLSEAEVDKVIRDQGGFGPEIEIRPSVTFPTAVERVADIKAAEHADVDPMPPLVKYEGRHTAKTDALLKWGYRHKKPIVHICSWLGLPEKKKGIVKGRANRLGLTDQARIVDNNKARAKAKK